MELNQSGNRYGYDDCVLHDQMLKFGFEPYCYAPFTRELSPLAGPNPEPGNTLYLKNIEKIKSRLSSATPFSVLTHKI